MKNWKFQILALILSTAFLACKDNNLPEGLVDEVDQDMATATDLVDIYLSSNLDVANGARNNSDLIDKIKSSITVLKFKDGDLVYNTNTDTIQGYHKIFETTVTATVSPGEMIFWFAGAGITSLDSIEFDSYSIEFLDELPSEIKGYKMWVVQVPEDYDPDHNILKYDIIYESKEEAGVKVRLDPKIVIGGAEDSTDGMDEEMN